MLRALAAFAVLVLTACSLNEEETAAPPRLASGRALPATCAGKVPPVSATVAFVAGGHAWALDPRTERLTCLFAVRSAGPFAWGPRGDRALLAHLEVKSFGHAPHRAAADAQPLSASWGRPIGKSIVFVGRNGHALFKTHPAGGGSTAITPIRGATYERVVYHPSGLAFAFVIRRDGRESVWIASNRGKEPRQLVHGRFHTGFDALAFTPDGGTLYFAALHGDSHVDIHSFAVAGATEAPLIWRGGLHERVSEIHPGPSGELAFTVGRSCRTRRAVFVNPTHHNGADALPDEETSRAVGWLDDEHVLVAAGGCGGTLDLYSVASRSLDTRLLVRGVSAVAVRRAEPLPPPPLPPVGTGSGFA